MGEIKKIYFLLFIYFGIILTSLFVYQKGFFIIKDVLPDISEVTEFQKPQANKVVLVIIDALRFDFTQTFEENKDGTPLEHFKNKLTVLKEKMQKEPNNTIHLVGYCDPPTATTQRIKALTIGNLPSFIEIAATFSFSKRDEDSLLLQTKRNNMEVVHLGDDVWTGLFADKFTRDFYADSLDIFDFHTTDNVVIQHLEEELNQPNLKLLIAHFNGVDHVGHALNSNHELMAKKLTQMNGQLEKIINLLHDDDVLILMGDHGMSEEGHHGGSTPEETTSVIFGYSKSGFSQHKLLNNYDPSFQKHTNQIDILSTICMLLGLPIPYNNLGLIINDFYSQDTSISIIFTNANYNLKQIYQNVVKVQAISGKMTDQQYLFIATKYDEMEAEFVQINNETNSLKRDQMQKNYILKAKILQSEIKEICRLAWNQLNIPLMLIGNLNFILCSAQIIALIIYLYILSLHYEKSRLCSSKGLLSSHAFKICAVILGFIGCLLIFEQSFSFILGLFLIPIQIYSIYLIYCDLKYIQINVEKKEEVLSIISPFRLMSRRTLNFLIYSVFLAYTMNSLHSIRSEDMMIWYSITLGVVVDCISAYKSQKFGGGKQFLKLASIPIVLYLAQYFDVTSSRIYVLAQIRFELIQNLMSILADCNIFFPATAFFFYLQRKQIYKVKLNQLLFLINFMLVTLYYVLLGHSENKTANYMNVLIARACYILMIGNAVLIQRKKVNYTSAQLIYAHVININIPLLMIINKHSFYLCLLFHYVLDVYSDYTLAQGHTSDPTSYLFFFTLIQYFYLISGHKSEITSLQVQSAYVGFEKFNYYISGFLLTCNQFSFEILGYFLVKYISKSSGQKKNDSENKNSSKYSSKRNYIVIQPSSFKHQSIKELSDYCSFLFYPLLMITATSINCTFNHDSLFLPSEFGPRFLFDAVQIIHSVFHIFIIEFISLYFM